MAKYSIKCSRCGAPIQWNKTALNVSCEYCGQPVNQFKNEDSFKNKFGSFFNKIPFPSKEKIRDKCKVLLSKQNVLSESQLVVVGSNLKRFFSKKRNILIIFGIPICFYSYMRINYPTKAKPFYPDFPYEMPRASYGENFKFFADNNNKATRNGNKYWCSIWRKNQPLSECLNSRKFRKDYFAIDSKVTYGDWQVFKKAYRYQNEPMVLDQSYDAAVNCKKGLIAFYEHRGLEGFYELNKKYPSLYKEDEKPLFERKEPHAVVRKMGNLWWVSDDVSSDLEDGIYLSWFKERVKESTEWLKKVSKKDYCGYREGFKHKCTNKYRLETINTAKSNLKSAKESLKLREFWRKSNGIEYSKLLRSVCKNN